MDKNSISESLTGKERILYVSQEEGTLNEKALFADETCYYRKPAEPKPGETVRFRFRTGRENADRVLLYMNAYGTEMVKASWDDRFDYYECEMQIGSELIDYYFEIVKNNRSCFYNKKGVLWNREDFYNFRIMPGFSTPDWAKGAVMYQIFVERFYNGDPTNDVLDQEYIYIKECVKKVEDWDKYPAAMGVREFYGGDLKGVMEKLDYLQDLGVDVIYFNPIFVSPSNHKYDIQDYDYIDPHFGVILEDEGELATESEQSNRNATRFINRVTSKKNLEASNQLFIQLVEEIHRRGMKVIIDGVFNHCGSFNKWMDRERIYEHAQGYQKGAYVDSDSPYTSFFRFHEKGSWPYNSDYDGWWGHETLPKLSYEESPKLVEYIMNIARKWVSPPYNCDGWRLDVAADLGKTLDYNHRFWKEFRKVVKEANPNAVILAEHYGDAGDWLMGDQWDSVMNYDAFMEPLGWFLTGMEKHSDYYRPELLGDSDAFFNAMRHHMSRFHTSSLQMAMNELSNHDHSRFLTRTNHRVGRTATAGPSAADEGVNKAVMREAVLVQMTWPGAPTLYYGDEAGLTGWTDPDNRRTYPWGQEDREMIQYHKDLIRIHKEQRALMTGSIKFLGGQKDCLCYGRFTDEEMIVIALNNSDWTTSLAIPVWEIGIPDGARLKQLMLTYAEGYTTEPNGYVAHHGTVYLDMPKKSAIILKYASRKTEWTH